MLLSLSIRDVVLIDRLEAEFRPGLCALTGETGAGKSILLEALGLAAGERADRGLVRSGTDEARVTAIFELSDDHPARRELDEAGITIEPGEPVILRRRLTADGRSQAWVNDQPASVGLLKSLGEALVEVHGQHDGRGLMDPGTHRGLLDSFARNHAELKAVREAWKSLADARSRVASLEEAQRTANTEEEWLRSALDDLDELSPVAGEEPALAEERKFLQHAENALTELQAASEALQSDGGLSERLGSALRTLERVADQIGQAEEGAAGEARTALTRATGALDRALIEFSEAEDALSDAAGSFEVEPGRLNQVEERLFALRAAARKHEVTIDELAALRGDLADRLDAIENAEGRLDEARKALTAAEAAYDKAASSLTRSREKAGDALAKAIMAELPPLKLDKARVRVAIDSSEDHAGPNGRDRVTFEIATNPGAPFGALDRIASGGELSRFALAIKVCLSVDEDGLVLIFDEVDQGVGGAVADAVGKRLSALAKTGQTLVVTHSPQVAARADHHWKIEKIDDGKGGVRTTLVALSGDERREEVARMLSGENVTDAARAQADQLIGTA
ncbi:MAG: DNA repair protein RecN [Maricaulis sp.]|jgi:DNA repair protein RecN (Recombination protein N)|nr:DNA repair protein RecN [Maricaulis sp.]HAQ36847.1 DNA repair protein RecN [Alphaproteobacteria bacterium]